ncbi:MAG: hypothetical protein NT128_07115 [Proteobacteria bacterium]|nr:hypothetical protein [Pseudomonadota bacterium]
MSKIKKLYLPLLVSAAMNIGNTHASDDSHTEVRVARNISMIPWEAIDRLRMSGFERAQERALVLTAAKIEAEVNGPAGPSMESIDRLRMSGRRLILNIYRGKR